MHFLLSYLFIIQIRFPPVGIETPPVNYNRIAIVLVVVIVTLKEKSAVSP